MEVYRYIGLGPHDTWPANSGATIARNDIIILLATDNRERLVLLSNGRIRRLLYPFEESMMFAVISP